MVRIFHYFFLKLLGLNRTSPNQFNVKEKLEGRGRYMMMGHK